MSLPLTQRADDRSITIFTACCVMRVPNAFGMDPYNISIFASIHVAAGKHRQHASLDVETCSTTSPPSLRMCCMQTAACRCANNNYQCKLLPNAICEHRLTPRGRSRKLPLRTAPHTQVNARPVHSMLPRSTHSIPHLTMRLSKYK